MPAYNLFNELMHTTTLIHLRKSIFRLPILRRFPFCGTDFRFWFDIAPSAFFHFSSSEFPKCVGPYIFLMDGRMIWVLAKPQKDEFQHKYKVSLPRRASCLSRVTQFDRIPQKRVQKCVNWFLGLLKIKKRKIKRNDDDGDATAKQFVFEKFRFDVWQRPFHHTPSPSAVRKTSHLQFVMPFRSDHPFIITGCAAAQAHGTNTEPNIKLFPKYINCPKEKHTHTIGKEQTKLKTIPLWVEILSNFFLLRIFTFFFCSKLTASVASRTKCYASDYGPP